MSASAVKPNTNVSNCRTAALLLAVILVVACARQQTSPAPAGISPPCPTYPVEALEGLEQRNKDLSAEIASGRKRIAELEQKTSDQEIRLLQHAAMVDELKRREAGLQKRLDEAISEVVRTKSKLRSVDSRAEAASTIAEAEIAIKAVKQRIEQTDRQHREIFVKAEQLLRRSTHEFKSRNYGGALYLAVQALGQVGIANRQLPSATDIVPLAGEIAFDPVLALALTKNTNLRKGPDLSRSVLTTLKTGTPIQGYSYKGDWIRVETENGKRGWVHQSLVTSR